MLSYPWAKNINLIADSSSPVSLCLTCSVLASRTSEHAIQLWTCGFFPFLSGLRVSPSQRIPQLSPSSAVLWHFIWADRKKAPKECEEHNSRQNSTKLPTTPRLSLHFAMWNDSSNVLVRPCWRPCHENRDGFVTLSPCCVWLCWEKARLAVSYS